jgi:predicted dinucleotide-binding enzyme
MLRRLRRAGRHLEHRRRRLGRPGRPATPFTSAREIAAEIGDAVAGKPVVDVSNRMAFGDDGPQIDTTSSNAEELAALLPRAHVIKAFNTLFAANQTDPIADGIRLDGFVAGDDPVAKSAVLALVASIGLDPVDVGPLSRARQLEGMAFLNIALNVTRGGSWQSGWKLVGAPASVPEAATIVIDSTSAAAQTGREHPVGV